MVSAGALRSSGETNAIVAAVPVVAIGRQDEKFAFIMGGGGVLLSDYKFGDQNYGGPFQFTACVGFRSRIAGPVTLGYWAQHYSDAVMYGHDTKGADMHLFELSYSY